ncbi:hypothetical protein Csa_003717 [Cucumis sativus]|nr:hypothetical protein Csa_003717 [Cucumis sativus]
MAPKGWCLHVLRRQCWCHRKPQRRDEGFCYYMGVPIGKECDDLWPRINVCRSEKEMIGRKPFLDFAAMVGGCAYGFFWELTRFEVGRHGEEERPQLSIMSSQMMNLFCG